MTETPAVVLVHGIDVNTPEDLHAAMISFTYQPSGTEAFSDQGLLESRAYLVDEDGLQTFVDILSEALATLKSRNEPTSDLH